MVKVAPKHGTPGWVELLVDDVEAAKQFYGELFEWEFPLSPENYGGYITALLRGNFVAGLGPKVGNTRGEISAWTTYLTVAEMRAGLKRCDQHGFSIEADISEVEGFGSTALLRDPLGASLGLFRGEPGRGLGIYDRAGALTWAELRTRDRFESVTLYEDVFGYGHYDASNTEMGYTVLTVPGSGVDKPAVGVFESPDAADGASAYWLPWFGVADCEKAADKVADLGGKIAQEPTKSPQGEQAVCRGPEGESFGLLEVSMP